MRTTARKNRKRVSERGVALIIVVISITVLTVMATEFAYNSRVDLQLAANARDEIRAYYLARSGIGLSRLIIRFQKQLDAMPMPNMGNIMGLLTGAAPGASAPPGGAAAAAAPTSLGEFINLPTQVQLSCRTLEAMIVAEDSIDPKELKSSKGSSKKFDFDEEMPELSAAMDEKKFGTFTGCFEVVIENESNRVNVARLEQHGALALTSLTAMFGGKDHEFLFEKPDSNNVQATPGEIILAMRDWADEDEVQSQINPQNPVDPFVKGFSDENYHYDRFDPRYKAKNARYDSLDELYLVHGVNDQFMAAFRDRLTVYPDPNEGLNINTSDPLTLAVGILAVADPNRPDPRLRDPIFLETVIEKIKAARMFSIFSMSSQTFVSVVQAAGVAINPAIMQNPQTRARYITDKTSTYRVIAKGSAGQVEKTITTVIQTDNALGKLLYWREE